MKTNKIIHWSLWLFGELILNSAILIFRGDESREILALNMVISSFVFGLIFFKFRAPWIDLGDQSKRTVGSMGISWFGISMYSMTAIGFIIFAELRFELPFLTQLIFHVGLLFILLLILLLAGQSGDQVSALYHVQVENRKGVNEMKRAVNDLITVFNEVPDLPPDFRQRIFLVQENLKFLSPTDNMEGHEMENEFINAIRSLHFMTADYVNKSEQIERQLEKAEQIYLNRKSIFSA